MVQRHFILLRMLGQWVKAQSVWDPLVFYHHLATTLKGHQAHPPLPLPPLDYRILPSMLCTHEPSGPQLGIAEAVITSVGRKEASTLRSLMKIQKLRLGM